MQRLARPHPGCTPVPPAAWILDAVAQVPIVYRDSRVPGESHSMLRDLRGRAADEAALRDPDAATALMIDVAEFESAVVDALCPDRDSSSALLDALRSATCAAARVWLNAREHRPGGVETLRTSLDRIHASCLPVRVQVSISEGFAYYALFPETYALSARRMLAELDAADICTIGLRNIGTCLAAVVSAAIRANGRRSRSFTARPRAHPFARELRLDETLAGALRHEAARGACFAIIDEGPGVSGSSFAAAVDALANLHIALDRIVLFPSWVPDVDALSSSRARAVWASQRKYWTPALDAGCSPAAAFGVTENAVDFSAGEWRRTIFARPGAWPDVQPQHERVKWYLPSERRLLKFSGLGRYGDAAIRRAHALADAGLGQRPGTLHHGFLDLPFVEGTPLARCDDDETAQQIGRYLGRVAVTFPAREPSDLSALADMVAINTRELLGCEAPAPPPDAVRGVEIDGRMLAHEWIRTLDGRIAKIDALDHHRDHFFPGVQSPAWDLAGAIVELRMSARQASRLAREYEAVSGDRAVRAQLPYFLLAYSVFRAGYCTMSGLPAGRYSQCALNAMASFSASSKSPRKQIARSSMNT